MISVEARGRLGNHLFQFAFGLATSARLSTDFAMNDEMLRRNFTLQPWSSPTRRLIRRIRYRTVSRVQPFHVVKVEPEAFEDPLDVLARARDRTHYVGFFQSEEFFEERAALVRRAFRPLPQHERVFREKYDHLARGSYVCCHVRQTDYREWGGGRALPASYYRSCLQRLACEPSTPIIAVGDDPEWLRSELPDERIRTEHNEEIVDLLLLANAEYLVISNSSFGWWGAWFNERASRIMAPRYWLGFKTEREVPRRILPERWEQVPVPISTLQRAPRPEVAPCARGTDQG